MNNKHQELIAEKVAELDIKLQLRFEKSVDFIIRQIRGTLTEEDRIIKTEIQNVRGLKEITKTLQDTIDTVLEKERDGRNDCLHTDIKHLFNGYGGILGFTENDLHNLVNTPLDKTPPNKV